MTLFGKTLLHLLHIKSFLGASSPRLKTVGNSWGGFGKSFFGALSPRFKTVGSSWGGFGKIWNVLTVFSRE